MNGAPAYELRVADRCDRCGSQAFVVTQHTDSELLWCGHHYVEHEKLLDALKVLDQRDNINTSASPAAY